MQTLSPPELAAFLLREVLDQDYHDIAHALDSNEAAVRQLVHRARKRLAQRQPRFSVDHEEHLRMMRAFVSAALTGDVEALCELLHQGCVAYSDAGGKAQSATRPVLGALRVAKFFTGFAKRRAEHLEPQLVLVNGLPALALYGEDGRCHTLTQLVIVEGKIWLTLGTRNPDKLAHMSPLTSAELAT
jgi:RNA polymerase sigma-70 factor (ECF subfamily)